jgi:hypothetical protein
LGRSRYTTCLAVDHWSHLSAHIHRLSRLSKRRLGTNVLRLRARHLRLDVHNALFPQDPAPVRISASSGSLEARWLLEKSTRSPCSRRQAVGGSQGSRSAGWRAIYSSWGNVERCKGIRTKYGGDCIAADDCEFGIYSHVCYDEYVLLDGNVQTSGVYGAVAGRG